MAGAVCYLEADASVVRAVTGRGVETWRAPATAVADEQAAGAGPPAIGAIVDAATWAASQAQGQRYDVVCIGVDRSLCAWINAPSTERQVILAAVRQREQDWGGAALNASVQPLSRAGADKGAGKSLLTIGRRAKAPAKGAGRAPSAHMAVLRLEDGAARLWLDELDRQGVRVGAVTTLWHAIAQAWAAPERHSTNGDGAPVADGAMTAVALVEPDGRITWAWADGEGLLAGGVVTVAPGKQGEARPAPECGRLALDWLTWSAQLGRSPDRVLVVGSGADALAAALRRVWPAAPIGVVDRDDPIAATLGALADGLRDDGEVDTDDPRACIVDLSTRPGRVHRRLYVWSAGAVALLAVGVAGLGWQMRSRVDNLERRAAELREEAREEAARALPAAVANDRNIALVRALESALADERTRNPEISEPPPAPPVLDELTRLAEQLRTLEGTESTVDRFVLSNEQITAVVRTRDVPTADALRAALTAGEGGVRWTGRISGTPPNVVLTLTGEWRNVR